MVEHTSAQTTAKGREQSSSAVERWQQQRGHLRHLREFESPELSPSKSPTSSTRRFSLFRWFRRSEPSGPKRRYLFRVVRRRASSTSSSSSSDSFYSTATVRSFAFHSGARRQSPGDALLRLEQSSGAVGPFAPGAVKLVEKRARPRPDAPPGPATSTLPTAFLQRQHIEARYSLLPSVARSSAFVSYDSIPVVERKPRAFAQLRRDCAGLAILVDAGLSSDSSISSRAKRVHVKGKRRAPDPPAQRTPGGVHVASGSAASRPAASRARRKRRAPQPPGYADDSLSSNQDTLSSGTSTGMDSFFGSKDGPTISNDTLVLRRGILLPKRELRSSSSSRSRTPTPSVCDSEGTLASTRTPVLEVNGTKIGIIMPRPWYKRNAFNEHSPNRSSRESTVNKGRGGGGGGGDVLRGLPTPLAPETKDENVSSTSTSSTLSSSFPFEGSLSRLGFFHRGDRHQEDKKKENKRKSGVSILMNISELDKEAAAIVQEEQARNRASMILQAAKMDEDFEKRMGVNEEIVQEIVNSSMENSPRRSTRALISKFNALGSITKVGVNSSFFKSNNASPKAKAKRFSQECGNHRRDNNGSFDERSDRDLSKYFLPAQASPKRESAAMFTEVINSGVNKTTSSDSKAFKTTTTTSTTTTTATIAPLMLPKPTTPTAKLKISKVDAEKDSNMELAKSLAAELDDVASGIARLRQKLDNRPKIMEAIDANEEKATDQTKETKTVVPKLSEAREKELANFDKEFTRIFDEIDKQLKTRDSRIAATKPKTPANPTSITNQVAKVLDILVGAEKEATAAKVTLRPLNGTHPLDLSAGVDSKEMKNKEATPSVVRISGVDDRTTAELKEMLKEMKHSLPKRPRPQRNLEKKLEEDGKPEVVDNKPPTIVQAVVTPKISTKVSSAVQTSGNVRRIEIVTPTNIRSNGNDEASATRAKSEMAKSTYQQVQDDEYVKLETARSKAYPENTYVNVIEKSLYANTQAAAAPSTEKPPKRKEDDSVSRVKIDLRGVNSKETILPKLQHTKGSRVTSETEGSNDSNEDGEKLEEIKKQYMNTLAVNRLLRKLEAAIASGNHQQAASLAKELAQLKIHCSVVRQRSCNAKAKLNLNMYIEDKEAHQGPIPLQLPVSMTVAQLKAKIHIEFEIPANVQRWIIGKNLADNDESTLEELQAVEGSPVFLYLVAPPDLQDKGAIKTDKQQEKEKEEEEQQQQQQPIEKKEEVERVINEKNDEQIHEIKAEIKLPPALAEPEPREPSVEAKVEPLDLEEKKNSLSKEEKLKRYEELMSLENCDVISNTEPIECPVCFMIFSAGEGVILRDCLHSFCRVCVANVVRYCEEAEVKCPYRDAEYTCESTLQEREIKALVSAEVYQQHLAKSIAQAENNAGNNAFHCKTPDCPGWCIYDDNVNNFLCPVCKVNNCLTCQAIHMGKNCREYQEELKYAKESDHESKRTAAMLEEMVERGEALTCPTCAVVLMKKWGCDWLRCSMCKTEICWVTRGPRWGPGGRGDTSGGCRCGQNGVKCHPRCNYCH